MPKLDMDAARAARREANGEAPTMTLDGKEYALVVELPSDLLKDVAAIAKMPDYRALSPEQKAALTPKQVAKMAADQGTVLTLLEGIARGMLGPHWEEVGTKLSIDDLLYMLEELAPVYGFETPGESSASAASS